MIPSLCGGSKPPSSTVRRHRLVRVADQPAIPGQSGEDRQIALGDAEGHVDARGVAPLGDDSPPRRITRPFGPPRGRTGPRSRSMADARSKSFATICGEIARPGVSCSRGVPGGGGEGIRIGPTSAGVRIGHAAGMRWREMSSLRRSVSA